MLLRDYILSILTEPTVEYYFIIQPSLINGKCIVNKHHFRSEPLQDSSVAMLIPILGGN